MRPASHGWLIKIYQVPTVHILFNASHLQLVHLDFETRNAKLKLKQKMIIFLEELVKPKYKIQEKKNLLEM